jgi:Mn-containing catalase
MSREITHMKAFTAALESLGKPMFSIGALPPTPGLVDQYFNDSTGVGDRGEPDARGPWNSGDSWAFVEAPAFQEFLSVGAGTRTPNDATNGDESGRGGSRRSNQKQPVGAGRSGKKK